MKKPKALISNTIQVAGIIILIISCQNNRHDLKTQMKKSPDYVQASNDSIQKNYENLNKELIAWYPLNGNAKDKSGNGNHGLITGGSFITDRFGIPDKAMLFHNTPGNENNAVDYISIKDVPLLNITGPFTISVWIKTSFGGSAPANILGKAYGHGHTNSFVIFYMHEKLLVWFGNEDENLMIKCHYPQDGKWHFVTCVYDNQHAKLFLDGKQMDSGESNIKIIYDNHDLLLGADDNNGDDIADAGWIGGIDDIRIYKSILTDSEIVNLYSEGGWIKKKSPEYYSQTGTGRYNNGKEYKIVKIGNQLWMAKNLNINTDSGSWAFNNDPVFAETYGRLYDWNTALKVCPEGWHLPSKTEWQTLFENLGSKKIAGGKMKEKGYSFWIWPNKGDSNASGFKAKATGFRTNDEKFLNHGEVARFWSSTEHSKSEAWQVMLHYDTEAVINEPWDKESGLCVRCLKDENSD